MVKMETTKQYTLSELDPIHINVMIKGMKYIVANSNNFAVGSNIVAEELLLAMGVR